MSLVRFPYEKTGWLNSRRVSLVHVCYIWIFGKSVTSSFLDLEQTGWQLPSVDWLGGIRNGRELVGSPFFPLRLCLRLFWAQLTVSVTTSREFDVAAYGSRQKIRPNTQRERANTSALDCGYGNCRVCQHIFPVLISTRRSRWRWNKNSTYKYINLEDNSRLVFFSFVFPPIGKESPRKKQNRDAKAKKTYRNNHLGPLSWPNKSRDYPNR